MEETDIASISQLPDNDRARPLLFYYITLPPLAFILTARVLVDPVNIGFLLEPIINVIPAPEVIYLGLKFLIVIF